jgi:hypothetical protein
MLHVEPLHHKDFTWNNLEAERPLFRDAVAPREALLRGVALFQDQDSPVAIERSFLDEFGT